MAGAHGRAWEIPAGALGRAGTGGIKPHIIGITESWGNNDIPDAELGLEGYVMFRKDRIGRRGGVSSLK